MLDAVVRGRLSLGRLVAVYSANPAAVLGLAGRKGALATGADADVVLVDLEGRRTLADDQVLSKAGWTPYAGRELRGAVVTTLLRGVPVAERGAPVAEPGTGAHVAPAVR
jgi:dihydroorotase-like cyclic amidohydrolase